MSLKTYIGTKIIKAKPQVCQKDSHNSKVGDPGYKVVYEDGYTSWSPKDVFEKAYRKTEGMTFGLAIEAMRKGFKVSMNHWPKDCFLYFHHRHLKDDEEPHDCIYCSSEEGSSAWYPMSQKEILSDKWKILEDASG